MKKLLLSIVFAAAIMSVFGANRYWVGGASANWSASSSWGSSSGVVDNAAVPVAGDDVYFDANSGANVTVYCSGAIGASTTPLNSLNMTSCNVTFAVALATTQAITANLSTTNAVYTLSAANANIVAGQPVLVYSGDGNIAFGNTVKTISGTALTLYVNPTAASTNPPTLAFYPTPGSLTTKTVTLNNANVTSYFSFTVNGGVGDGSTSYDFSFLGTSTFTFAAITNSQNITLGNGGTFTMTGNSASNYFDGNNNAKITFNTTSTLNMYFNQSSIAGNNGVGGPNQTTWGNGWYNITNTKGTINIMNSLLVATLTQNAANSQTLVLGAGTVFTLSGNNSCYFGTAANAGAIDASNSSCKFIIPAGNPTILTSIGTIVKPGTASAPINWFEFNRSNTYTPYAPMFVKNLVLTSGTINNSTNNITVVNGGTITRTAGKVLVPPIYGTTPTDKVNLTIAGNCTADNEILGTVGKIGALAVNTGITYTMFNPTTAPGFYLSAFNGGLGYTAAPTPTISAPPTGSAPTWTTATSNYSINSITSSGTGLGLYTTAPTITFGAPASASAWVASTAYALNAIVLNGSNYYVCNTAGTSAATGGPTVTGTSITDGTAKWFYLGTALVTATASAAMLPTSITVLSKTGTVTDTKSVINVNTLNNEIRMQDSKLSFSGLKGHLSITGLNSGDVVFVYRINGQLAKSFIATNAVTSTPFQQGMYIVKVVNAASDYSISKVIIK